MSTRTRRTWREKRQARKAQRHLDRYNDYWDWLWYARFRLSPSQIRKAELRLEKLGDQVNQHPDDENGHSSPPDGSRTRVLVVKPERETQQRRNEHHPPGTNSPKVEPVHAEGAEQNGEDVGGALGLRLHVLDQDNAGLNGRSDMRGIYRPPHGTVPPLPLTVRIQVPARIGGGRRRSHDSTVSDILSPDCRDGNKHRACLGDAWNDTADKPCACECACHDMKEETT